MEAIVDIKIRNGEPSDHERVVSVMREWWGGRDLAASVLKIFFIHFQDTLFIAEEDQQMIGFLVGFLSQSESNVGYIHFAGVHPDFRKCGIGRTLYQKFFDVCAANGRTVVKSCTSPINRLSIDFHVRLGFEIEPGDSIECGLPVSTHFLRPNDPKVLFRKSIKK